MINAPELVAVLDTLTTPDSEHWHVILAGKTVHIMAVQEDPTPMGRKRVSIGLFEIPIAIFKKRVRTLTDKGNRPLGCITVILCLDNLEAGINLLAWLKRMAKEKNFSLLSLLAEGSTAEAVERQRESLHYVPAGFASIASMAEGRA
jgi:hypothetical protein